MCAACHWGRGGGFRRWGSAGIQAASREGPAGWSKIKPGATQPSDSVVARGCLRTISACRSEGLRGDPVMRHDGLTRSPSGLSERRTGFSPPELGSPTAPVVPPTGAVPYPLRVLLVACCRARPGAPAAAGRRPQVRLGLAVVHRLVGRVAGERPARRQPRPCPPASPRRRRRGVGRPRREHARARGRSAARRHRAAGRRRRPRPGAWRSRGDRRCRAPAGPAVGRPAARPGPGAARRARALVPRRGRVPRAVGARRRAAGGARARGARRPGRPRRGSGPRRPRRPGDESRARRVAARRRCRPGRRPARPGPRRRRRRGLPPPRRTGRTGRPARPAPRDPGWPSRSDAIDDVVAHLGVVHLHHLVDDAHVPRAAERGVFPGVIRDAVRRCADVVVAAVDDLAVAS